MEKILFDVDGTLLCGVDYKENIENALSIMSMQPSEELVGRLCEAFSTYEKYICELTYKLMASYLSCLTKIEIPVEFIRVYNDELLKAKLNNIDEVRDVLAYLSRYYQLGILSNYFKDAQIKRLKVNGLYDFFEPSNIFCGEDGMKPQRMMFNLACGNVPKSEVVMIGDGYKVDYLGAINAGLNAILIDPTDSITDENIKKIKRISELKNIF